MDLVSTRDELLTSRLRKTIRHGACIGAIAAAAQAPPAQHLSNAPIPRAVLALSATHQADRNSPRLDHVHALLQTPLNYLGMVVREHDLGDGPPSAEMLDGVRAIVTYFRHGDTAPDWLWPWLEQAHDRGVRFVHFGELAPLAADAPRLERWLRRFGLGWDATEIDEPARIRFDFADPTSGDYEATPIGRRAHRGPWNESERNSAWVTTYDAAHEDRPRTPVVIGPWGGIALEPWAVRVGGEDEQRRWHIDPFAFFTAALDLARVPAPDPSVVNGRRAFLLHVDGDGFESVSTVDGQLCGQVFLERIVDRYALPMSVSVIVASLTDDLAVAEPTERMRMARELLNRPHVEPASHAVLHPLNWRRKLTRRTAPRTVNWYAAIANYPHDMVAEVRESVRFINQRLLDDGNRCKMMFWSGVANPTEPALLEAARLGCGNLNGGVYRWDAWTDSVGFVAPWGKRVGSAFQVYCGAPNENVYDGFFTTMPTAFRHVSRTLENTGRDRILKPANLYVHFYSAERPPRLRTLEQLIERWAFAEETAPIFASEYARAVHAAQHACEVRVIPDGFRLRAFDGCPTVRIDDERRFIDWSRSRGIHGARRVGRRLFVHLTAGDAELVFRPDEAPRPHIEQADHHLSDVTLLERGIAFTSTAHSRRTVVVAGFEPGAVVDRRLDGSADQQHADSAGRVLVELPLPGSTEVRLLAR